MVTQLTYWKVGKRRKYRTDISLRSHSHFMPATKAIHVRLYSAIPSFDCIEGCTDCCGPVPWSTYELRQAGLKSDPEMSPDGICQFSLKGKCEIHQQRPFMCRLFGAAEDMLCPHGRGPLKLLPATEAHDLVRRYKLETGLS
jgi:hypothetical protein